MQFLKNKKIIGVIVVIVVVAGGFFAYKAMTGKARDYSVQARHSLVSVYGKRFGGGEATEAESNVLVKQVKNLITINSTNKPFIAVVSDPSKLSSEQAFFAGAKKGDVLLIWADLAKAVIYDPDAKKIINVGPLVGDQQANGAVSPAATTTTR